MEPQRRRKPFNPKRWICTDDSEPKCTCTETRGDANSSDDSCGNCRRKYRQVMCEDGTEAERKKRAKKFE